MFAALVVQTYFCFPRCCA